MQRLWEALNKPIVVVLVVGVVIVAVNVFLYFGYYLPRMPTPPIEHIHSISNSLPASPPESSPAQQQPSPAQQQYLATQQQPSPAQQQYLPAQQQYQ